MTATSPEILSGSTSIVPPLNAPNMILPPPVWMTMMMIMVSKYETHCGCGGECRRSPCCKPGNHAREYEDRTAAECTEQQDPFPLVWMTMMMTTMMIMVSKYETHCGFPRVRGSYHGHTSPAILPGSTRIVPPLNAPNNRILPPRLDDHNDDDHGIEIRNTLLMWWRMQKITVLLLILRPFSTVPLFLLPRRYERCTITTRPPRRDGSHTVQHNPYT